MWLLYGSCFDFVFGLFLEFFFFFFQKEPVSEETKYLHVTLF